MRKPEEKARNQKQLFLFFFLQFAANEEVT
jgi:hypothetical protein